MILYVLSFAVWALFGLAAYIGRLPWALATLLGLPVSWALISLASTKRGDPKETRRRDDVGAHGQ
jgi:hypothetical protein